MTQRERFEVYAESRSLPLGAMIDGSYYYATTYEAWLAWQSAQPPLDPTPDMIEAGAQALVQWACDGLTWPDSWSAIDVQSARRDAEKAYRAMIWEHMKRGCV